MLSGLSDGGSGLDQGTVSLALGVLRTQDAFAGVDDGWVFGSTAAEQAATGARGARQLAGGVAVGRGVAVTQALRGRRAAGRAPVEEAAAGLAVRLEVRR